MILIQHTSHSQIWQTLRRCKLQPLRTAKGLKEVYVGVHIFGPQVINMFDVPSSAPPVRFHRAAKRQFWQR